MSMPNAPEHASLFARLRVTFWSLWYLRPSMIYWRIHRTIKGVLLRMAGSAGVLPLFVATRPAAVGMRALPPLGSRYHCEDIDIVERRFSFLRDTMKLPEDAAQWPALLRGKPLLWQFHFGYHDYLLAILADRGDGMLDAALNFACSWDRAFPLTATDARRSAWHPYVLSIRIESWVRLHGLALHGGVEKTDARLGIIATGVEQMTRVLLRNLEKGTMANHLLRNIKALVFAGLALESATGNRARRIGLELLARELAEQVLLDGCHFERSPMYHVSMLNDVLDMAEAMQLAGEPVPEAVGEVAARMTRFLEHMRHPDGEIPYFNDATSSFFLRTDEVLQRGRTLCAAMGWTASSQLTGGIGPEQVSGLLAVSSERLWTVFDAGLVGPDYQPGHAHCDTLSFELSVDGRRWITDTGVYHYKESPERRYSRSTAAHSTIAIDDAEQSEVWKSFRVGRRARILHIESEQRSGMPLLRGAHDGYTRIGGGLVHERALLVGPDWLLVMDWLHGRGTHRWVSRLQLHPDVRAEVREGGVMLRGRGAEGVCTAFGASSLGVREGEYYPAFGERFTRPVIEAAGEGEFPHHCAMLLGFGTRMPVVEIDVRAGVFVIDGRMEVRSGL